jgi:hypothetical protein
MATTLNAGTSTSGAAISADTTGILSLQSGSTPTTAVTIDTSQNVGIGTASPTAKLDVNGQMNATTAYIKSGGSSILYYDGSFTASRVGVGDQFAVDTSGNFRFASGYGSVATAYGCRAWVNFNGTGTVAIRASGNVSSITDVGVGYYRVNFANAMPDANYCITGCPSDDGVAATLISSSGTWGGTNQTTTSALMFVGNTGAGFDRTGVTFAFFR